MNILYISALEGGKYSGPLYSVPNQVESQGKVDNVYWVNLTNIDTTPLANKKIYHYIPLRKFSIRKMPEPFNKPDIVIFEEFFKIECCVVARQCLREKIPYVIIPRCQMTKQYLQNKKLKKKVASLVMFNRFAQRAKAVHFLTEQEKNDSVDFYSGRCFVEANGIVIPNSFEKKRTGEFFVGTFIGRYSVWQKGLDILIEAIEVKKDILKEAKIKFNFYGPDERTGNKDEIQRLVDEYGVSDIVKVNGPVFGEDKKNILIGTDFFVHTSRFEGMPMSVLDALSYGVPCLVSQGSNVRELVESANAGWGADNDVSSVANALEMIAKSDKKWLEIGKNALTLASRFSWDEIAVKCHKQYEELMI